MLIEDDDEKMAIDDRNGEKWREMRRGEGKGMVMLRRRCLSEV
jgi:hypothetical protein